jgi:hypothetical protein
MTPAAVRALSQYWYLKGFAESGRGFHGEIYDTVKYPSVKSILVTAWRKAWHRRHFIE